MRGGLEAVGLPAPELPPDVPESAPQYGDWLSASGIPGKDMYEVGVFNRSGRVERFLVGESGDKGKIIC